MKFGPVKVEDALGTILAHSTQAGKRRIRKGCKLNTADISDLKTAGIEQVTVAALSADDVHEDDAAEQLANALIEGTCTHLRLNAAFTGRVNIYAESPGIFRVDADAVNRFNRVDPSITVSTLSDLVRVQARDLVATVKIIPFAAPGDKIKEATAQATGALTLAAFKPKDVTLILTRTAAMKESLLTKGKLAIEQRLQSLGCTLCDTRIIQHNTSDLADALAAATTDLVLILTASATSDENDVGPAALLTAGGELARFGMPVDPGNLLFLGIFGDKTIVGLPGCARSPALNGADWVLERLISGIDVKADDIAAMGVGGLLKEISTRPQPRGAVPQVATRPNVEVIMLAAGASSRMSGVDKLLENIDGEALLRRSAKVALNAQADTVLVVLPPDHDLRQAVLEGLAVNIVPSPDWKNGMSASILAGLSAVSDDCDAVIVALADMPEITPDHMNRLIAAFDPTENREICRAVSSDGTPGHPVLFGRRFFETLAALSGDRGARDVLITAPDFLVDVQTMGQGAVIDLDTPQDWANWRAK